MITYKKAKNFDKARRIQDFLREKGVASEVKRNNGFMSGEYPFEVVGADDRGIRVIERHEGVVNALTGEKKRKATWNKHPDRWNEPVNPIRT